MSQNSVRNTSLQSKSEKPCQCEYIWRGWRFNVHHNLNTLQPNSWSYTLATREDLTYRGFKPSKEVADALDLWVQSQYADMEPDEFLEKMFSEHKS